MVRNSNRLMALLCIVAVVFMAFGLPDASALPASLAPLWLFLFVVNSFVSRTGRCARKTVRPILLILVPRPPPATA